MMALTITKDAPWDAPQFTPNGNVSPETKPLPDFALQNVEMAFEFKLSSAMTETQAMIQNATQIALEMCLDGIALGEVQQLLHHVFLFVATKFK